MHAWETSAVPFSVDGSCITTLHGRAAGYAIVVGHASYTTAIAEPLPDSPVQDAQTAEVKALLSALELVHAMRPRDAVVLSDSSYAVRGYNDWMTAWQTRGWAREGGGLLANKRLWKEIVQYPARFEARRMDVAVEWRARNSTVLLERADALAREACLLNHYCGRCCTFIGREGTPHDCQPVCNTGACQKRRFVHGKAYDDHVEDTHSGKKVCRREDCERVFGSLKAVHSHEVMAHDGYVHDCEYCTAVFREEDDKDEHEREECRFAPYCRVCGKWFSKLHAKKQHDDAVHDCY